MSYDPYDGEYYENEYDLLEPDEYDGREEWDHDCDRRFENENEALLRAYNRIFGPYDNTVFSYRAIAEWNAYCMRTVGYHIDPFVFRD